MEWFSAYKNGSFFLKGGRARWYLEDKELFALMKYT